jgi:hypothetical protein
MGASLMHHQAIHKYLISAHASGSCTMLVGGLMGNVLACLDDPGRFYNRGNTRPNTDFSTKIPKSGRGGYWDGVKKWWGTCPGVPCVGPPGCGVTRGCFGDAVVVSVPQLSNTCNTYRYIHIPTHTYISYLDIFGVIFS